jgi:hypothetical protein
VYFHDGETILSTGFEFKRLHGILAAFGLALLQGCLLDLDDDHHHAVPIYEGYLVVNWTIERSDSPFECDDQRVAEIAIGVVSLNDGFSDEYVFDCRDFEAAIPLVPGDYTGEAVLLDDRGREVTTPVNLDVFGSYEGVDTYIPINFPYLSFL